MMPVRPRAGDRRPRELLGCDRERYGSASPAEARRGGTREARGPDAPRTPLTSRTWWTTSSPGAGPCSRHRHRRSPLHPRSRSHRDRRAAVDPERGVRQAMTNGHRGRPVRRRNRPSAAVATGRMMPAGHRHLAVVARDRHRAFRLLMAPVRTAAIASDRRRPGPTRADRRAMGGRPLIDSGRPLTAPARPGAGRDDRFEQFLLPAHQPERGAVAELAGRRSSVSPSARRGPRSPRRRHAPARRLPQPASVPSEILLRACPTSDPTSAERMASRMVRRPAVHRPARCDNVAEHPQGVGAYLHLAQRLHVHQWL